MASAIRRAVAETPDRVVVALAGRGHVERGDGIPVELRAAGGPPPLVLVPWEPDRPCGELTPDLADFVFGIDGLDAPDASADNRT